MIQDVTSFISYFESIRRRTLNYIHTVPEDQFEWRPARGGPMAVSWAYPRPSRDSAGDARRTRSGPRTCNGTLTPGTGRRVIAAAARPRRGTADQGVALADGDGGA